MPEYIPNYEDHEDFSNKVSNLRKPSIAQGLFSLGQTSTTRELADIKSNIIPYDAAAAKRLKNHKIYKWLSKNNGFNKALITFKRSSYFKKYKNTEVLVELEFLCTCSFYLVTYHVSKNTSQKIATKSKRKDALKSIRKLLKAISSGIELDDYSDTRKLISLLNELDFLIETDSPTLFPKRNTGHLREKWFAQQAALGFEIKYGKKMRTVIEHLLEAIDAPNISKSTVDDWMAEVKIILQHKNNRAEIKQIPQYKKNLALANALRNIPAKRTKI